MKLRNSTDGYIPETMTGDASSIRQVLFNLLINAVKSTKDGEIAIQVNGTQL